MKRVLSVVVLVVAVAVTAMLAFRVTGEATRRAAAVEAAVAAARAEAAEAGKAEIAAAVAEAVAATEARLAAAQPKPPAPLKVVLDTDPETVALFPDGAFLMEVGADHATARCTDVRPNVHWVRLREKPGVRSEIARQEVNPLGVVVGWMTFGLTAFGGPEKPVQTIFAARTEGRYTTLILGALRGDWDDDLVPPQFRLTLYRLDASNFAVVERAPLDAPPAARPAKGGPAFTEVLRRCAYQGRTIDLD